MTSSIFKRSCLLILIKTDISSKRIIGSFLLLKRHYPIDRIWAHFFNLRLWVYWLWLLFYSSHIMESFLIKLLKIWNDSLPLSLYFRAYRLRLAIVSQVRITGSLPIKINFRWQRRSVCTRIGWILSIFVVYLLNTSFLRMLV